MRHEVSKSLDNNDNNGGNERGYYKQMSTNNDRPMMYALDPFHTRMSQQLLSYVTRTT